MVPEVRAAIIAALPCKARVWLCFFLVIGYRQEWQNGIVRAANLLVTASGSINFPFGLISHHIQHTLKK